MTRIYRACATVTLIVLLFIGVGGCWSAQELNNRAFVNTVLVDRTEDGQVELTLGVPLPNRMIPGEAGGTGQPQGGPFSFVTRRAENLSQALNLIDIDLPRDITFGQTRVFVIGRREAEHGLDEVVEFVFRQPSFRLSASLFVTPGEVREIIETPMVFERILSDILRKYVTNHHVLDTTVKDYKLALYQGGDILVPLLHFRDLPGMAQEDPKKNRWLGSGGAAIFSGGKMTRIELTPLEQRTALWISSQLKNTMISIPSPTDGKEMSFYIEGIKTSIEPKVKGDQLAFRVVSSAKAYVASSLSQIDLKNPQVLLQLEELLGKDVEEKFIQVLDKTRKARSDAFLMSQYLDWSHPEIWHKMQDQWKNYYAKELPIEVDVKIKLNRTGGVFRSVVQETNR